MEKNHSFHFTLDNPFFNSYTTLCRWLERVEKVEKGEFFLDGKVLLLSDEGYVGCDSGGLNSTLKRG